MSDRCWNVYVHTNKINGKKYIGITSQLPHDRWMNGNGYSRRLKFGRAIEKYGWDSFEHEIVNTNLSEEAAKSIEQRLIREFHTYDDEYGYNMTMGGDGVIGFKHTDEAKQIMSLRKIGENHPNYQKHLKEVTRNKIAERLVGNQNALGAIRSEETKCRMSNSKKKTVAMYLDDTLVRKFDSALDAQSETGISRKNISLCCLGHRRTAGGYRWKFA